jgi:Tfp pilus assembly PilM family ATPase
VFTTVVDFERLSSVELGKSIRLQADSLIPTPLTESKLDWALIGDSPVDKTKVEVLISSVPNDFVESRLDMLESIGLNVIAFEPDNLALTRAMLPPDATLPQMVLDIGSIYRPRSVYERCAATDSLYPDRIRGNHSFSNAKPQH